MHFKPKYFCIALAIFILEVLIATVFSPIAFIRGSLGDVLVVMLLYFLSLAFLPVHPVLLTLIVFVFACAIEVGQFFQFAELLGLEHYRLASILLGNTFSWGDISMYLIGCLAALVFNQLIFDNPRFN